MSAISDSLRHHAVGIGTSLVFVLGVAIYVLLYLPQQEAFLRLRYFRVLERIGHNLQQRSTAFGKRNEAVQRQVVYEAHQIVEKNKLTKDEQGKKDTLLSEAILKQAVRSLENLRDPNLTPPRFSKLAFPAAPTPSTATSQPAKSNPKWTASGTERSSPPADIDWLPESQQLQFALPCELPAEITKSGPDTPKKFYILSTSNLLDFVSGTLRRDVFKHFLILGKTSASEEFSQVYYSTFAAPATVGLQAGLKQQLPQWLHDTTGIQANRQTQLTIAGQSYQLFVHPLRINNNITWLLCGAVPTDRFGAERQALPGTVLEAVLALIVLSVLALPLLKIMLMSAQERLSYADVMLCGIALVVGMGLLMLITMSPNAKYIVEPPLFTQQLIDLANSVNNRLVPEIDSLNTSLRHADSIAAAVVPGPPVAKQCLPSTTPPNTSTLLPDSVKAHLQDSIKARIAKTQLVTLAANDKPVHLPVPSLYPKEIRSQKKWQNKVDRILWLDEAGEAVLSADASLPGFVPNLKERDYFKQAIKKKLWPNYADSASGGSASHRSVGRDSFLLASVVNYGSTGDKTAVVVRRSTVRAFSVREGDSLPKALVQPRVCLYSTELRCLDRPVLPPGYSFCLIDASGEVLFHSDPNLSLSENLLQDCEPAHPLRAAMLARTRATEYVQYQGRRFQIYLRPVETWPVYLVAMADLRGVRTRQMQTLSLAATLWGGVTVLGLLFTGLLVVLRPHRGALLTVRDSFLRLWPRTGARARRNYRLVIGGVVGGIAWLAIVASFAAPLTQLFLLLLLPLYLFGFTYRWLRRWPRTQTNGEWRRVWIQTGMAVFIANAASWPWLTNGFADSGEYGRLLGFQLVLTGWLIALSYEGHHRPRAAKPAAQPHNARVDQWSYAGAWLAWVVALSVVPAVYCYHLAYQAERELQIRYTHLSLFRALRPQPGQDEPLNYLSFFFNTDFQAKPAAGPAPAGFSAAETNFHALVTRLHPAFDSTSQAGQYALLNSGTASSWAEAPSTFTSPTKLISHSLAPDGGVNELTSTVDDQYLGRHWYYPSDVLRSLIAWVRCIPVVGKLFGVAPLSSSASTEATLRPWLGQLPLLALLTGGLYWLLLALNRRLYHLDIQGLRFLARHSTSPMFFKTGRQYVLSPADGTYPAAGTDPKLVRLDCRRLSVLDDAGKTSSARQLLAAALNPAADALKPTVHTVVLEHFDFQAHDLATTRIKLELLQQLVVLAGQQRLVVVSRVHPTAFADCGHARATCPNKQEHAEIWAIGDQLFELLANFEVVYRPIAKGPPWEWEKKFISLLQSRNLDQPDPNLCRRYAKLYAFARTECQALPFLNSLRAELVEWLLSSYQNKRRLKRIDVVLRLQRRAQLQFRSLWQSLSPYEQYLLYDLAQDGLINSRNALVIEHLLRQGLLRYSRNKLRLVNESFRNFILSPLLRAQALRIEQETDRGGTWAAVRLPLFMLLAALALFIFVTQRNTWSEAQTYLTALAGVLPLLSRLLSFGPPASSTSSAATASRS